MVPPVMKWKSPTAGGYLSIFFSELARACCRTSSAGRVGARGSFYDFVGAGDKRGWDVQAEHLRGL
jgi:hypothetical protein